MHIVIWWWESSVCTWVTEALWMGTTVWLVTAVSEMGIWRAKSAEMKVISECGALELHLLGPSCSASYSFRNVQWHRIGQSGCITIRLVQCPLTLYLKAKLKTSAQAPETVLSFTVFRSICSVGTCRLKHCFRLKGFWYLCYNIIILCFITIWSCTSTNATWFVMFMH